MTRSALGHVFSVGAFVLTTLLPVHAADAPGVLWETTSQVVMEGMPMQMPVNRMKLCAAQEWNSPPPAADQTCTTSNYHRDGLTATWDMQCTGQMPMTGHGEITFNSEMNSYTGQINATADQMNLTIKLTGTKVGTCDNPR